YLAALRRFAELEGDRLVELVEAAPHVRGAIGAILERAVDQSTKDRENGCLLTSAAIERAHQDAAVRNVITATNTSIVRAVEKRLRAAQASGEIAAFHDPPALARFFAAQLVAIRVTSQTVHDRKILEGIARVALGVLG
ncbi:MAG TPA: TetR family transcriptional regulator C-terminal domain-containing protein, partial [Labilithrix sp.]